MSLISASNTSITAWEPIQATAQALRQGCAGLEQSLEEVFLEVDAMRQELLARFQDVHQERHRLASREAELDKQLQEAEQQVQEAEQLRQSFNKRSQELDVVTAELASLRKELEQVREHTADSQRAEDSDVQRQLSTLQQALASHQQEAEQLRRERDELRQEMAAAERISAASVAESRSPAAASLPDADDGPRRGDAPTASTGIDSTDAAVTLSPEQLAAMQQEREALEAELEVVRNRAAELNETVSEQQLEMVKRQTEMGGELQQLRRLVDKQADLFVEGEADVAESKGNQKRVAEEETPPAADPVVNSVMAQFAKLQKDVAQRRRRR